MNTVAFPLTLFYDASCPLCRQEVELLRQHDLEQHLRFVDCSAEDFAAVEGKTRDAMMRLIHARDAGGRWLVGPPVFGAAYRAVGIKSIGALWESRWLQPMWKRVYPWIADNRMWLSKIGVVGVSLWIFKKIAAFNADKRAKRVVARSCGVDRKDCA